MPFKDKNSLPAKQSRAKRNAKYYRKFKKKLLETRRPTRERYYKENKNKWEKASSLATINRRKRLYGVDAETYNKMAENQNNRCAICGNKNITNRSLVVDHDHKTGLVRGLLCDRCNVGIGCLKDDITILQKAIIYLT